MAGIDLISLLVCGWTCFLLLMSVATGANIRPMFAPVNGWTVEQCNQDGYKMADATNLCRFHECIEDTGAGMKLLLRECPVGLKTSITYVSGQMNPCTEASTMSEDDTCARTLSCSSSTKCMNGGEVMLKYGRCVCKCPKSWNGSWNCERPTVDLDHVMPDSNICIDGKPGEDWCSLFNGCLNGGTCYNQCDSHWCDCPDPHLHRYKGEHCEKELDFDEMTISITVEHIVATFRKTGSF